MLSKPPIGVSPKDVWLEERLFELSRAVYEYMCWEHDPDREFHSTNNLEWPVPKWISEMKWVISEMEQ